MRVAIIGGGITGLSCSVYLSGKGISTVIFESKKEAGGLAKGFNPSATKNSNKWKWNLEIFYHHIFTNDKEIIELAKTVGAKILINKPVTSSWLHGKEMQLDSPLSLLRFSELSFFARLRMGFGLFALKMIPNGLFLEKYKATEVLPELLGKEGYDLVWKKLLTAKFGPYVNEVNLAWFWSRVAKRTKNLGYFEGGFDRLVEKMEVDIKKNGGEIRLGTEVKSLTLPGLPQLEYEIRNDEKSNGMISNKVVVNGEEFDAVVVTTPAPIAEKLLKGWIPGQARNDDVGILDTKIGKTKINYLWGQTLILELSRKILNGYWLNILEDNFPFLVTVEHTNMIDKKMYGNNRIVYLGNYLPEGHKQLSMTKEELVKLYTPFIKKINGHFDKKLIKNSFLFREPFAQPVFPVNYSKTIPNIKVSNGVYLANMSMVYPFDRGTNYAVKMGRDVAKMIIRDIKKNV